MAYSEYQTHIVNGKNTALRSRDHADVARILAARDQHHDAGDQFVVLVVPYYLVTKFHFPPVLEFRHTLR
jgi:hypothetical protein